jgi:hypothetical protein
MTKIPSVEKVVEQLAQQEWLMIGDVPTAQHWLRKALFTYAQTVAEEAVRAERERASEYMTPEDGAAYLQALTPLPDKE